MFVYIYIFIYLYVLVRSPRAHATCTMHYSIQGKNTIVQSSQWIKKEINVCSAGENEKEH